MHIANNCGCGLKQLAFRHLSLFKHPFCRYCPDKHQCLKTGAYSNIVGQEDDGKSMDGEIAQVQHAYHVAQLSSLSNQSGLPEKVG